MLLSPRTRRSAFRFDSDKLRRFLLASGATLAVAAGLIAASPGTSFAAGPGPCDIYASNGTPCVAAHSTTRALFQAYNGNLYQVRRASDNTTRNIGVLAAGDFANAASQDSFCANTTCVITIIYDQTSRHNDLTPAPPGGVGGQDNPAPADALPVTAGGHIVYGLSFSGIMGLPRQLDQRHRDRQPARGHVRGHVRHALQQPLLLRLRQRRDEQPRQRQRHMDAIYFGTLCWFSPCNGAGPWVMADLENGLFQSNTGGSQNGSNTGNRNPYVTTTLKNNGTNFFASRTATRSPAAWPPGYSGALPTSPSGYSPMRKEGAIILGIGGDNSNTAIGSFFEGAMTQGLPSDSAESQVQANVVSVGYGGPSPVAAGTLNPGSTISLRATDGVLHDPLHPPPEQQRRHLVISSGSSALGQGRRLLDRAPRSGQQLVRVVRVAQLPG
jgi:hypothetical protein